MEDLDVGTHIKNTSSLQYLGVTFTEDEKSTQAIYNKIGQERRATRQLSSDLYSSSVTNIPKTASITLLERVYVTMDLTYRNWIKETKKR